MHFATHSRGNGDLVIRISDKVSVLPPVVPPSLSERPDRPPNQRLRCKRRASTLHCAPGPQLVGGRVGARARLCLGSRGQWPLQRLQGLGAGQRRLRATTPKSTRKTRALQVKRRAASSCSSRQLLERLGFGLAVSEKATRQRS